MAETDSPILTKMKEIKARDIMSLHAITINDEALLFMAAHLLMRFKISGLPVVDKNDKVIGIITVSDFFRMMGAALTANTAANQSLYSEKNVVKNVMTKNVVTIKKDTTFYEMLTMMCEKNIHTLPVLENDCLIGIVGRRDVINTYYKLVNLMWH